MQICVREREPEGREKIEAQKGLMDPLYSVRGKEDLSLRFSLQTTDGSVYQRLPALPHFSTQALPHTQMHEYWNFPSRFCGRVVGWAAGVYLLVQGEQSSP